MKKWRNILAILGPSSLAQEPEVPQPFVYMYNPDKLVDVFKKFNVDNLSEQERTDGARVIVEGCMHVKPGEKILIVSQNADQQRLMAKYLEHEGRRLGATVTVMHCSNADLGEGMEVTSDVNSGHQTIHAASNPA